MSSIYKPLISVIIPVYNEDKDILDCINSLKNQSYKPLELIFVDDGSTDRTEKLLKKIIGIRFYKQEHLGPGAARNKGAKKARGKILVFVDADMTFQKSFIDKLTRPIREGRTIGTFSREEYVSNYSNKWARNWSINRGWQEGRMHPEKHKKTQKVFRAILKDKFLSVNGFDSQVGYTDDWTLARKLKSQATQADGAVFYHKNPETLKEVYVQAKWMAKRPYKLGILGRFISLLKASLPVSIIVGFYKAVKFRSPSFIVFKIIVDYATFFSISSLFLGRKRVR